MARTGNTGPSSTGRGRTYGRRHKDRPSELSHARGEASLVVAIPAGIVVAIISASVRSSEDNAVDLGQSRSLYSVLGGDLRR